MSGSSVALPGDTFKSSREFVPQNFSLKQKKCAHASEEKKGERERAAGRGRGAIWKASKVICTRGEFKMIMDNSKVWPHEGAKIVHSQYFTAAARLTGARGLGNTSKSTRGEQCHLERKRENEAQRDREIKTEEERESE